MSEPPDTIIRRRKSAIPKEDSRIRDASISSSSALPNDDDDVDDEIDSDGIESPAMDSYIVPADSLEYWNSVSPDVDGMLGGYPQVSRIDLQGSRNFLVKLVRRSSSSTSTTSLSRTSVSRQFLFQRAVDCGAGIGRITNGLLLRLCEVVDVVEPVEKFAEVLRAQKRDSSSSSSNQTNSNSHDNVNGNGTLLPPSSSISTEHDKNQGEVGEIYVQGLESWRVSATDTTDAASGSRQYDLIWIQWCVGHLTDTQLVEFLRRAADPHTLSAGTGHIVLKENLSTDPFGADLFDELDSSVTRSNAKFGRIFDEAGLTVVKEEIQKGFPKSLGLYPVKMWALKPR